MPGIVPAPSDHAHEGAAQVDRRQAVALIVADLVGRLDRLLDAGVVEGDVQATQPLDAGAQRRLDVVGPRYVAGDGERLAANLLDQLRRLLVAVGGDVGDYDACALAGEGEGGGASDAVGRSGDERDLACEAPVLARGEHHLPLCVAALGHGRRSTLTASRWSIAR
jgi:hypothetical protein